MYTSSDIAVLAVHDTIRQFVHLVRISSETTTGLHHNAR